MGSWRSWHQPISTPVGGVQWRQLRQLGRFPIRLTHKANQVRQFLAFDDGVEPESQAFFGIGEETAPGLPP